MSRRSAPDSPWQNGVPPFGLGQQFNPMMNVSPVWGQSNLPFMGGGNMMSPDMMRFGGNVSSRSNFNRRFYDQPDNRYRGQQRNRGGGYGDSNGRYGRNQQNNSRGGESRKRFANRGDSDRSPPAKRPNLSKKDAPKKAEKVKQKAEEEGDEVAAEEPQQEEEEEEELYDPAEPTNDAEAAANGDAEKDGTAADEEEPSCKESEGKEGEAAADAPVSDKEGADGAGSEAQQEDKESGGEDEAAPKAKGTAKAAGSAETTEADGTEASVGAGQSPRKAEGTKPAAGAGAKPSAPSKAANSKAPAKATQGKSPAKAPQSGQKVPSKPASEASAKSDSKKEQEPKGYQKKGSQRGKGWCTVCELHFVGSFLDHRRGEDHKVKRDEKYPKCHPCSMGFNNKKQYEQHCAGDFHRKNVEVLDNEVDESAGPLGEEYLEEVAAFFCTLCKLLLKAELKTLHCCTQGHYRRHRDLKRKEEAALRAKQAKEEAEKKQKEQQEEEEEDVSQMAFTITDEIVSDDEGKADAAAQADKAPAAEATEAPAEPQKKEEGEQADQPSLEEEGEKEPETKEQGDEATETMDTGEAGDKEDTISTEPAVKETVAAVKETVATMANRGRGRGKVIRGRKK
ncbi:unnamed protein product [Ixodes hexagonus]